MSRAAVEQLVGAVLGLAGVYLVLGAAFAVALHARGLARIDPASRGAGWFFRLLITPGLVALWPLLAQRWRRAVVRGPAPGPVHRPLSAGGLRSLHRRLTLALLVVVPLVALAGIVLRPGRRAEDGAARPLPREPPALAELRASWERPFGALPVRLQLRGAGDRRQLEFEIAEDLEIPHLLAYGAADEEAVPASACLLGAVWGPGTRRFDLDRCGPGTNVVVLYSLAWQKRIAALSLPEG